MRGKGIVKVSKGRKQHRKEYFQTGTFFIRPQRSRTRKRETTKLSAAAVFLYDKRDKARNRPKICDR